LSSKLGGPKRALTTLLNARLIAMITRLIAATASTLDAHAIRAPLMVVRGDGALVSAAFAMRRPIETILSGPAASLVGARVLTGLNNAFVSDIGGTTTDVAVLDQGRPRLDPEGATVGGFRTMVEAVAMRTFGLGGDSEVVPQLDGMAVSFKLGPRRLVPLSLAATMAEDTVLKALERQLSGPVGRLDARFAFAPDVAASGAGLTASEAQLLARLTGLPQALDSLLSSTSQAATLDRLVTRGLAQIAGFTPSDAAHVLGRQDNWNADAAKAGAALLARRKDNRGMAIATSAESLSASVLQALSRRSAEVIMETALVEDGLDPALVRSPLLQRGLDGIKGHVSSAFSLDRPLIGLGASAGLHYAELDKRLGAACIVPPDAGVANAVGAVAGQVRISATVTVARPDGERFRVSAPSGLRDFLTEGEALVFAEQAAREEAIRLALSAGAAEPHCAVASLISAPMVEGQRSFMDAQIVATASGRPTIARASSST
jgi:N-methylhydantoinase A/oxoprolinase/acetone carboxylase beta subunit